MRKIGERICRSCGTAFDDGSLAWYCPACRLERKRARSREYERRKRAAQRIDNSTDTRKAELAAKIKAARRKAYYESHREEEIAYAKAYNKAHYSTYYPAKRKRDKARQEANKEKLADKQKKIRDRRVSAGYSQAKLGALIGVSGATISSWEIGHQPANWEKLRNVFPDL